MPRTVPWHSVKADIYHNNSDCEIGTAIPAQDRREGSAGKRLCPECEVLNRARAVEDEAGESLTAFSRRRLGIAKAK